MAISLMLPAVMCFLLMGAHWLRAENLVLVGISLAMVFLLWIRRPWMRRVVQVLLVLAALEWVRTTYGITQVRMEEGKPWARAAVILLVVAGLNLLAAGLLEVRQVRRWYRAA